MECSISQWNKFIAEHAETHILQTGAWGELKAAFGWRVIRILRNSVGAQILFRPLAAGFTMAYLPKGPVGGDISLLQPEIDQVCKKNKAVFIKFEPDVWEPTALNPGEGWKVAEPIQPRRTVLVSLEGSEEEILGRMKQKTRYNIRLAEKKGITVKTNPDMDQFYEMMKITGSRDNFGVHARNYYQTAYRLFNPSSTCECFTAFYQETPLASLMVFALGNTSWYMYGASSDIERNRMPTYLLQWEAMRWAKSRGCKVYDLWGIPDHEEDELEEGFSNHESHDGLWGVYRFKRGFGGEVARSVGAWDRVFLPALYQGYHLAMKLRRRVLS